jgi:predicted kinase
MKLKIPELAVVALIGPSGSGKSSFARKHFRATEVLSSDYCRGLVSDDETSQAATNDAFDVLYYIASKRLAAGKLVVIDATNVQTEARKPIVALGRQFHCLPVAIVLICLKRSATNEIESGRSAILGRMWCANKRNRCAERCEIWNGKVFERFTCCIHWKK